MKTKLLFLAFLPLFCASLVAGEKLNYTITAHPYRFSTYYEMDGSNGYEGRAVKNAISIHTCYELYDANGTYVAEGVCRILSLGALFSWAREIDVYDEAHNKIGFIDGQAWTTASAKYAISDATGHLIAYAYLDYNAAGFTITDTTKNERPIAYLKRNKSQSDWAVTMYANSPLDVRILKVFSAFVVDYQDIFSSN